MCNKCGTVFEEDAPSPEQRRPCPACGSLTRRAFADLVVGAAQLSASATFVTPDLPSLLLQTIVVAGAKTTEGLLIEAVTVPWLEIAKLLKRSPHEAYNIPPRKWEEIIAGAYRAAGFDEVVLTPRSGDLGRDIIAVKHGVGSVRIIDQVKAYRPNHLVTADDARALLGVLWGDRASKGFLTTTSDFAPGLPNDPLVSRFIPQHLELINGTLLLRRLDELATKLTISA